ncbi:CMGC/SRPK protein kinase [Helicocarpus griseus UAMH5409]|uniref:non-specific serine/threonine protein kinase n=1 Tax=Helicocarpus griseus UAMH5409 TaxID=1447875 RepID=A0A2B7WVY2_9EURO|nr:CMGC/SRPK protein kinase [Helicocarpus griseus UAMH5409]
MYCSRYMLIDILQPSSFHPARFYPVRLGDTLNGRYQLAIKLGYGSSSTVWLARDLNQWRWLRDKYVALKITASVSSSPDNSVRTELDNVRRISEANPQHKGWPLVRHLLDYFTLESDLGGHLTLVFEPLREPLWLFQQRYIGDVITSDLLKIMLQMILLGLDYLHSECHIITPITDFDLSVPGDRPNSGCIQAEIYRAPEVIFDAGFSYSAEIWSLGIMLWDVLEGKRLFRDFDQTQEYDDTNHLAHLIALLGPPQRTSYPRGKGFIFFMDPRGTSKAQPLSRRLSVSTI